MKMSGNTAQAGASSSASTTPPNTPPKNVSKTNLPIKNIKLSNKHLKKDRGIKQISHQKTILHQNNLHLILS